MIVSNIQQLYNVTMKHNKQTRKQIAPVTTPTLRMLL